jgi:hypothetical protein
MIGYLGTHTAIASCTLKSTILKCRNLTTRMNYAVRINGLAADRLASAALVKGVPNNLP